MKDYYIIPIFVPHEGCPHDCVFCNQGRITGENKKDTLIPKNKIENNVNKDFVIKTIKEYIKTINKDNSVVEISFFGGTFTAININKQRELLKVAKEYKDKGIINFIRLSTRPDYIDTNILNHLQEFDVDVIELGVQSLDDDVLLKSGRGHTTKDVIEASKLIKEYGFTLGHQIMIGLPGDTFEKDIYTTEKSLEMNPNLCRIYPALTIRDTPMEDMYLNKSYIPYSLDEAIEICEKIYKMYRKNNVNIIRIGLQPTDNIALGKDIVAGPFHPAFRELVESKILNGSIYEIIKDKKDNVIISIHPNRISKLYSGKKKFFNELKLKTQNITLEVKMNNSQNINHVFIKVKDVIYTIEL